MAVKEAQPSLATAEERNMRYVAVLVIVATLGCGLAAYGTHLMTVSLPTIARALHMSSSTTGLVQDIIYVAEFLACLVVGRVMDTQGRKRAWLAFLFATAVFTFLTVFVRNYGELAIIRALASGCAQALMPITMTMVNEQVPAKRRGLLYSMVQGGWSLGVVLAAGVYLLVIPMGWHWVFVWGSLPIVVLVVVGYFALGESSRWVHLNAVRKARESNDAEMLTRLEADRPVAETEDAGVGIWALWSTKGEVRRRLTRVTVTWLFYSGAFTATNVYIVYWLVHVRGWSSGSTSHMLLIAGGVGYLFYILGGWWGEHAGRKMVLVCSALLTVPLSIAFVLVHSHAWVLLVYLVLYQTTNGTWSGAGYTYCTEVFPTRVRASATSWLGAMFVVGMLIGSIIWTGITKVMPLTDVWWIIAVGLGVCAAVSSAFLPNIKPGQELEEISA